MKIFPPVEMDSRSIDFAKTASIDMMSLNNKVVNMRQVVKRTKVRVINKLCKNITALKKKKGTDEQRTKNLRKAERLIEEIESIKKLKEDKVSKFALANTASFEETTKITVSPGPRALARLADHPLIKKAVSDFREQHHDWRDLAAYLLVKQTGRRFKTKKQKQKKLAKSVENINASETMTKVYIQERFGKEGLSKAEQRFERKRKRQPPTSKSDIQQSDTEEDSAKKKPKIINEEEESDKVVSEKVERISASEILTKQKEHKVHSERDSKQTHTVKSSESEQNSSKIKSERRNSNDSVDNDKESQRLGLQVASDSESEHESETSKSLVHLESVCVEKSERHKAKLTQGESRKKSDCIDKDVSLYMERSTENEEQSSDKSSVSGNSDNEDAEDTRLEEKNQQKNVSSKNECVIKALNIGDPGSENFIDSDSASGNDSDSESENEDDFERDKADDGNESDENNVKQTKKQNKQKFIPEFLMQSNKTLIKDPFFAGSGDGSSEESDSNDMDLEDDFGKVEDPLKDDPLFSRSKTGSMFHNPDDTGQEGSRRPHFQREGKRATSHRRGGLHQIGMSFRGRDGDWHLGNSQRSRGFNRGNLRGQGRGQSFGDRPRRIFDNGPSRHGSWNDRKKNFSQDESFSKTGPSGAGHSKSETNITGLGGSDEKLHPSWEASKRRKAEQSGIAAFKGSKITFDDD